MSWRDMERNDGVRDMAADRQEPKKERDGRNGLDSEKFSVITDFVLKIKQ